MSTHHAHAHAPLSPSSSSNHAQISSTSPTTSSSSSPQRPQTRSADPHQDRSDRILLFSFAPILNSARTHTSTDDRRCIAQLKAVANSIIHAPALHQGLCSTDVHAHAAPPLGHTNAPSSSSSLSPTSHSLTRELEEEEEDEVAWNIQNRYYAARVHFAPRHATFPLPSATSDDADLSTSLALALALSSSSPLRSSSLSKLPRAAIGNDDQSSGLSNLQRTATKDVFAVLEEQQRVPGRTATAAASVPASARAGPARTSRLSRVDTKSLRFELLGVQAIILVLDEDLPLETHKEILQLRNPSSHTDTDTSIDEHAHAHAPTRLLDSSNFAICILLLLPRPLIDAPTDAHAHAHAQSFAPFLQQAGQQQQRRRKEEQREGVRELWIGEGWEVVELCRGMGRATGMQHGMQPRLDRHRDAPDGVGVDWAEERDEEEEEEEEEEEDSFSRIHEALQAHLWPSMIRLDQQRAAGAGAGAGASRTDRSEDGRRTDGALAAASSAQTCMAKDEQLARAFLARMELREAQLAGRQEQEQKEEEEKGLHWCESLDMEELERFLRETDPDWPGDDDEEALGADVRTTPRPSSSTFDDDFDDFVSAGDAQPRPLEVAARSGLASIDAWRAFPSFPDDDDHDHDHDDFSALDAATATATAAASSTSHPSSCAQTLQDFDEAVRCLRKEAERVRRLADGERKREAERLAFRAVRVLFDH